MVSQSFGWVFPEETRDEVFGVGAEVVGEY